MFTMASSDVLPAAKAPNPVPLPLVSKNERDGGPAILACVEVPATERPATADASAAEPSDEALFARVRAGDRASLGQLVRRHEAGLFALLVKLVNGDAHRADDLFQETFLRAVRSAETFDASKRFRPWLTAIAVNLVRDDARKRKLRSEVPLEAGQGVMQGAVDTAATPDQRAAQGDEAARVRDALKQLTEKEREVVLLHFYDGMTLAEAATALEIPLGTVKSRLHGALTRLKGLLDGLLG